MGRRQPAAVCSSRENKLVRHEPDENVLNYRGSGQRPPRRPRDDLGRCGPATLGLLFGSLISFVAWYLGWNSITTWTFLVVVGLKLAIMIVCSLVRGWLGFGLGVLYSMFVGIMIWVVSCFAHFEV